MTPRGLRLPGPRLWVFLGCLALALNQLRATLETWGKFILAHPGFADFGSYYVYARVAWHHGLSHLYDSAAQRQEWLSLGGAHAIPWFPPIYPPPLAWVVMPFALWPYPVAFAAWSLLLLSLLLLTWRLLAGAAPRLWRWSALAATLALFPVLFALVLGQVLILELAAVAGAWWMLSRGRQVAAGLLLTAIVFKPQVAFLVPLALLLAGRRRAVAAWAAASAAVASLCLLTTGLPGLRVYALHLLHAAGAQQEFGVPTQFTLQGLLGSGLAVRITEVLFCGLALAVAYRHRHEGVTMALAAALVGSMLATPYLHDQDLSVLLLAGAIAWQGPLQPWQRRLSLAGYAVLLAVSYWGFGSGGVVLGPILVLLEAAWLACGWWRDAGLAEARLAAERAWPLPPSRRRSWERRR